MLPLGPNWNVTRADFRSGPITVERLDEILRLLWGLRTFEPGLGVQVKVKPCALDSVDTPGVCTSLLAGGETWWGFGFRLDTNEPPKQAVDAAFRRRAAAELGEWWGFASRKAQNRIRFEVKSELAESTAPRLKATGFVLICPRTQVVLWSGGNTGRLLALDVISRFAGPDKSSISTDVADHSALILDALLASAVQVADEAQGQGVIAWPCGSATFVRKMETGSERISVVNQDFASPGPALSAVLDNMGDGWKLDRTVVLVGDLEVIVNKHLDLVSVSWGSVRPVEDIVPPLEERLERWLAAWSAVRRLFRPVASEPSSASPPSEDPLPFGGGRTESGLQRAVSALQNMADRMGPDGEITIESGGRSASIRSRAARE